VVLAFFLSKNESFFSFSIERNDILMFEVYQFESLIRVLRKQASIFEEMNKAGQKN